MHEALYYQKEAEGKVRCNLCPQNCLILPGKSGSCRVRKNLNGTLFTEVFGKVASIAVDPIEKKPLYHFHPGKKILSIGNVGCNLHCNFCQNHEISQCDPDDFPWFRNISSDEIVEKAKKTADNVGIAFTYNEPFTFYEFMKVTASKAKENGLKNVVVSNGYINEAPLESILPFFAAFNIDLKAFTEGFYRKITKGRLAPVMDTLKKISRHGAHLEITNLIIPGLNDDEKQFMEMIGWIADELGPQVPLHLSRYFPRYRLDNPTTPIETLDNLYSIARKKLLYVYVGNISGSDYSDTLCPDCGTSIITRKYYSITVKSLNQSGECANCGYQTGIKVQ